MTLPRNWLQTPLGMQVEKSQMFHPESLKSPYLAACVGTFSVACHVPADGERLGVRGDDKIHIELFCREQCRIRHRHGVSRVSALDAAGNVDGIRSGRNRQTRDVALPTVHAQVHPISHGTVRHHIELIDAGESRRQPREQNRGLGVADEDAHIVFDSIQRLRRRAARSRRRRRIGWSQSDSIEHDRAGTDGRYQFEILIQSNHGAGALTIYGENPRRVSGEGEAKRRAAPAAVVTTTGTLTIGGGEVSATVISNGTMALI